MTISAVIQTGSSTKTAKAADEITAKRVYGDLNEDGKINIFDLMHLKTILLNGDKENKMLKFADVDGDGETSFKDITEMAKFLMTEIGIFEPELELDSDDDGLCDYFEQVLGTDIKKPDSDDDGLSDYEEVFITFTDPLNEDTDGTGKKDGLKDFDNDGLSNAEELKNNTDIFSEDTDNDGIKDAEEVSGGTKPGKWDSDDDGISDFGELKLGTDPNLSSTDGKTPDSKRYFDQTMSEDKLAEVNADNRLYTLSVSAHAAGCIDEIMNVKVSTASNALANRATYGTIIDVDFEETVCDTTELEYTMLFHLDTDDNPDDYMVFYYSEADYLLVPFETLYDGKNISMTYNQKGTFCLVNINALDFSDEEEYDIEDEILSGGSAVNDVAYELTLNQTTDNISYAFYFKVTNFNIKNWDIRLENLMTKTADKLLSNGKTINAHVVFYGTCSYGLYYVDFSCDCVQDFKDIYVMAGTFFSKHITDPFSALNEYNIITSNKNIAINNKIRPGVSIGYPSMKSLPVIFDFGGSSSTYSVFLDGNLWNVCGSKYSDNNSVNNFRYMTSSPSSADTVYNIILNKHGSAPHYRRASYFGFVPVSSKITEGMIKAYINSNGAIKSGIKTADDSVDVLDKMDMSLIKIENGKVIYPTYGDAVSKNSKTKKGSEILTEKKKIAIDEFNKTYYEPFRDDPYTADHDGDGLKDDMDPDPLNAFDNKFELVNKYDADPYELFPKYVLYSDGDTEYMGDDYEASYYRWYNSDYQKAIRENDIEKINEIKFDFLNIIEKGSIRFIDVFGFLFGKVSGSNLKKWIDNKPVEKNKVVDIGSETISYVICYSRSARKSFYDCMNLFFECSEDTVIPGNTISLSSSTDNDRLLPGTPVFDVSDDSVLKTWTKNIPYSSVEWDILLGVSSYNNAIAADRITSIEKNGEIYYTAKMKFYILDLYDYGTEFFLDDLQDSGLAAPYLYSSCKNMEITWKKGTRFPEYSSYDKVDLNKYQFKDIEGLDLYARSF